MKPTLQYRLGKYIHACHTKLWRACDNLFSWPDIQKIANDIPFHLEGGVGGDSYTSWVYQQGYWGGLLTSHISKSDNNIIDLACGEGKLATTLSKFIGKGFYWGFDIDSEAIGRCIKNFGTPKTQIVFSNPFVMNPAYNKKGKKVFGLPLGEKQEAEIDIVVCVSLFTHLQYEEALHYLKEIYRVLKTGGKAFITFHIVEGKNPVIPFKEKQAKTYEFWIPLDQQGWWTSDVDCPEKSIGITEYALDKLIESSGNWQGYKIHKGSIMGTPSAFMQDVVILEKG